MKKLKLKRLLQKRNNGGFTLVEVVISCALLSILILGVVSFAGPAMGMISSGKKNASATMLAETINTYISGSLKFAKYVAVFENVDHDAAESGATELKVATNADKGLNEINTFMSTGTNASEYEVRCIGIRWLEESITNRKKLMLTNEAVDNNFSLPASSTMSLTSSSTVFDAVMYDGLFPVISLDTFAEQSTGSNAKGYKITTSVYSDIRCYNSISDAERDKSTLAFEGSTFVKCLNMVNPASDICEVSPLQTRIDSNKGSLGLVENGTTFYYPDTYIYYVVMKK